MSQDPDFAAAAAEAGDALRRLFPSSAVVEAQLRDALTRARALGGPTGGLAAGLIEVLEVAHRWNLQAGADPAAVISPRKAAEAVIDAVSRGMVS